MARNLAGRGMDVVKSVGNWLGGMLVWYEDETKGDTNQKGTEKDDEEDSPDSKHDVRIKILGPNVFTLLVTL